MSFTVLVLGRSLQQVWLSYRQLAFSRHRVNELLFCEELVAEEKKPSGG